MARKRTSKAPKPAKPLVRLQASMKSLQRDAEKLLRKTGAQASGVIGRDQKKALDRVIAQVTRLRDDLEERARRLGREFESRTEKFFKGLERETSKRFLLFMRRFDIPTRHEIHALVRRMDQLEKTITSRPAVARRATAGTRTRRPTRPSAQPPRKA